MSNDGDSAASTAADAAAPGTIHGGRGNDSRTYSDGINTGWAGGSAGGGNTAERRPARRKSCSARPAASAKPRRRGVILNVIPRDGGNTFSGQFIVNGANGAMQGSNYTQSLKDQGLKTPSELISVYDVNPMGGGRIIRDKLWFYLTYRQIASGQHRCPACGSTGTPATRTPGRSISTRASRRSTTAWIATGSRASRGRRRRATRSTCTGRSSTPSAPIEGRRHRRRRRRKRSTCTLVPAVAHQHGHLVVAADEPAAARGRLGHATRRGTAIPSRGSTARTTRG